MKPTALLISYQGKRFHLEAVSCGRVEYSHYPSVWHNHPVYHLILVTRGRHYLDYDDQRTEQVGTNTLILINPGAKHQIRQIARESFEHIGLLWCFVDEDGHEAEFPLQELLGVPARNCPAIELSRLPPYEVHKYRAEYNVLLKMMNRIDEESCWQFKFFSMLYSLLEHFQGSLRENQPTGPRQDHLVDAMEQLLLKNFVNPAFSLSEVAEKLGRSPNYLSARYSRKFGVTFSDSLRRKRMERAQMLLHATGKQIQAIASQCGFSSVSYFCRCFRKEFGLSPFSYRQQKRELSEVFHTRYQRVIQADPGAVSEH